MSALTVSLRPCVARPVCHLLRARRAAASTNFRPAAPPYENVALIRPIGDVMSAELPRREVAHEHLVTQVVADDLAFALHEPDDEDRRTR